MNKFSDSDCINSQDISILLNYINKLNDISLLILNKQEAYFVVASVLELHSVFPHTMGEFFKMSKMGVIQIGNCILGITHNEMREVPTMKLLNNG